MGASRASLQYGAELWPLLPMMMMVDEGSNPHGIDSRMTDRPSLDSVPPIESPRRPERHQLTAEQVVHLHPHLSCRCAGTMNHSVDIIEDENIR